MRRNLDRRGMLGLTGAALAFGFAARAGTPGVLRGVPATRRVEGRAFATTWRITLPDGAVASAPVQPLLDEIDRQMSPWREDSEISAFNRARRDARVSPATALVAGAALAVAKASAGWFDPTVGPLVARWGFGPIARGSAPHWQGVSVSGEGILKDDPGLTLDLCGIAKGYALDQMAARLADAGHEDFLIDLGGELAARGRHPSGRDWQVAVEDPRPGAEGAAAGLRLGPGMAVATSGLSAQSYALGRHRYGHIIDPHHALPVEGPIASVSVLARTGMTADAWATALTAADDGGPELARANGIAALFLFRQGSGLRKVTTGGFESHLI